MCYNYFYNILHREYIVENFFRNKPLVITIIAIIILLVLVVSTANYTDTSGSQMVAGGVFVPVQKFFYQITDDVSSYFDNVFANTDVATENQELKEELALLKSQLADYEELEAENERLSAMLDYKESNPEYTIAVADIVSKNPGNWFDIFTINLGSLDGIELNMPVITADGLVGRVSGVGLTWAKVTAIIDGSTGISAIVERTRDIGSVRGRTGNDPMETLLDMNYLSINTDIEVGDTVLTSGVDKIYPKGLIIGEVVEVGEESNQKKVVINPAVNFKRLEEVMVLMEVTE
jgi:rod shape-determining protein MreC